MQVARQGREWVEPNSTTSAHEPARTPTNTAKTRGGNEHCRLLVKGQPSISPRFPTADESRENWPVLSPRQASWLALRRHSSTEQLRLTHPS